MAEIGLTAPYMQSTHLIFLYGLHKMAELEINEN
jgi:hypothetical protein